MVVKKRESRRYVYYDEKNLVLFGVIFAIMVLDAL